MFVFAALALELKVYALGGNYFSPLGKQAILVSCLSLFGVFFACGVNIPRLQRAMNVAIGVLGPLAGLAYVTGAMNTVRHEVQWDFTVMMQVEGAMLLLVAGLTVAVGLGGLALSEKD